MFHTAVTVTMVKSAALGEIHRWSAQWPSLPSLPSLPRSAQVATIKMSDDEESRGETHAN